MKLPSWWPHKEGDWGQEAIQPVAPSNEYQGQETEKVSMTKNELNIFNVEEWQKTFQEGWRQMIKQTFQELSKEERDLEKERLLGRIGALTKRIDNLEIQFAGFYDSCCDLMGRVKSLENQMLWNQPVETNDRIAEAVRQERDANNADRKPKRRARKK